MLTLGLIPAAGCLQLSAQHGAQPETLPVGTRMSFSQLNQALIQPACASCHSAQLPSGGLNLSSYSALMASGSVVPGSANTSSFYRSMVSGTMPKGGAPVSAPTLGLIADWINEGAKEADPLTISTVRPELGTVNGGTTLTITGSGFTTGATVRVGDEACTALTLVSSTSLHCLSPAHAEGSADVVLTQTDGSSVKLASGFFYQINPPPAPTVTNVSPSSGSAAGGTLITIAGTGFVTGASVTVGGLACTSLSVISASQLTCRTSAHAAGAVNVIVANPDSQTGDRPSGFTYTSPAPTFAITSITPVSGVATGGTLITVHGSGFTSGLTISVAGLSCTGVLVTSSQATCNVPAHSAGTFDLIVTSPSLQQSATMHAAFTYTSTVVVAPAPTVSSFSPTSGTTAGGTTLTLNGSNFVSGASISLGGTSCTSVTLLSSSQLRCLTSTHSAGTVGATVTNPDGKSGSLSSGYTYVTPATIVPYSTVSSTLQNQCASCHGNVYSSYSALMSSGWVVSGNAAGSVTYQRVANGSMPQGPNALTSAQITAIFNWINAGAHN